MARNDTLKLQLVDHPEGEEAPKLAVYALDRTGETMHTAPVSAQGEVKLTDAVLEKAAQIVVAPAGAKNADAISETERAVFHAEYIREVLKTGAELQIPAGQLIGIRRCVDGTIERCV